MFLSTNSSCPFPPTFVPSEGAPPLTPPLPLLHPQPRTNAGEWTVCSSSHPSSQDSRHIIRATKPQLSEWASVFLPPTAGGVLPETLEEARVLTALTWCRHQDAGAVSLPLYTQGGDETKVVAQVRNGMGSKGMGWSERGLAAVRAQHAAMSTTHATFTARQPRQQRQAPSSLRSSLHPFPTFRSKPLVHVPHLTS